MRSEQLAGTGSATTTIHSGSTDTSDIAAVSLTRAPIGISTTGLSPMSDNTVPASASSDGRSPKRRIFRHGSLESNSDTTPIARHWMLDSPSHAPRACEKCRLSKRKCDKKLPHCDRCLRLNAKCHYLQDVLAPNANLNGHPVVVYQPQLLSHDALLRGVDPIVGISVSQILSLVSSPVGGGVDPDVPDWRVGMDAFFKYVHPWYGVVHRVLFEQRLAEFPPHSFGTTNDDSPPAPQSRSSISSNADNFTPYMSFQEDHEMGGTEPVGMAASNTGAKPSGPDDIRAKELALLVVAMHLATRARGQDPPEDGMFDEAYRAVKRMSALLFFGCAQDPLPSLELVQCGALLALFEFGHGEAVTAYRTLSQAAATAEAIGVKPGLVDPGGGLIPGSTGPRRKGSGVQSNLERQQGSSLWWGLFIIDQYIHTDSAAGKLPFIMQTPSSNTLLPETPPVSVSATPRGSFDKGFTLPPPVPRKYATASLVGSEDLGPYQLSAKTGSLLHRALRLDKERGLGHSRMKLTDQFIDLDYEIRQTTYKLLEQDIPWNLTLDSFTMCVSALFTLYIPYLPILKSTTPAGISADQELATAMAALRFTCKMSTDISCKIGAELDPTQPTTMALLAAPAGITCFYVILALAGICQIFPEEREAAHEAIGHKFESLHFFGLKWGLAEKMIHELNEMHNLRPDDFIHHSS